jgi:hypothetical protein
MRTLKAENHLLATHISNNPEFEAACLAGDANKILTIVDHEMEEHGLFTKGANKLKSDIIKMLNAKKHFAQILMFVWNSRLSGTGDAVIA